MSCLFTLLYPIGIFVDLFRGHGWDVVHRIPLDGVGVALGVAQAGLVVGLRAGVEASLRSGCGG